MPRELPLRPDLEHLKKQAKALLPQLQRRNPTAKLADAQHAVARQHGSATWAALKKHVSSVSAPAAPVESLPVDYAFDRYTARARQALFFSRFEAAEHGQPLIDPVHLLVGVLRAGRGELAGREISLDDARRVLPVAARSEPIPSTTMIPFGEETKQVLRTALEESDRLMHSRIGMGHLVLGILRDSQSPAALLLSERGWHADAIRRQAGALAEDEG